MGEKINTKKKTEAWLVLVTTFPPRECGIATFSQDLVEAMGTLVGSATKIKIVAINPTKVVRFQYPKRVMAYIDQDDEKDYQAAADKLNLLEKVKLVSLQHEFGIFGGENGKFVLTFLKALKKPAVVTFHCVLPNPDQKLYETVRAISENSEGLVVMTEDARKILREDYGIVDSKIKVIPHGIHSRAYTTSWKAKQALGLEKRTVLSTFGFLNKNKGLEYVLEALPEVVRKFPEVVYIIFGATHPNVLKAEGEAYRNSLIQKVYDLGLERQVKFYDAYFPLEKLLQFLEATDIYLSTSTDPNQAVSGTLSYALGMGRPVISTAFAQAREAVTDEVGILVDFKKPQDYTEALLKLLGDAKLQKQMGMCAYFRTRQMIWPNVAIAYAKYLANYFPNLLAGQKDLPPITLKHVIKMTDDFGMIQFANLTEPDLSSGYTADDNSRALLVAGLYYEKWATKTVLKLIDRYLHFIELVTLRPTGDFVNYVGDKRQIDTVRNKEENLQDAQARTLWVLARVAVMGVPAVFRKKAREIFDRSLEKKVSFQFPRPAAFYIKGLYFLLLKWQDPKLLAVLKEHCQRLVDWYEKNASSGWEWFEDRLTYSNAILPEALLLGFVITGEQKYLTIAKKTLDFLIKQTFERDLYLPIGQSGWYVKGSERQYFDQQPEDVSAMVSALKTMFLVTKDSDYQKLMLKAFNWFLGENVLDQVVYDRATGGCYDGVGKKEINLNQGAESTLAYLLARFEVEN